MASSTSVPPKTPGHALYAAFASFAVACFIIAFLTDLAYWRTESFLWETISAWLLTVGCVAGAIAIPAGLVDLVRSRTVAGLGQPVIVVLGQVVAFGLSIVNVFVHSRDGYTAVVPEGLALSSLVVLVLLVTMIVGRRRAARKHAGGFA